MSDTVDTNSLGARTSEIDVSTSSRVCMFVKSNSGNHNTHRVQIQLSPDGTNWFDTNEYVTGTGIRSLSVCAMEVRGRVATVEGSASSSEIFFSKD